MAFQTIRGTFDLLPAKIRQWREIEQKAIRLAELYGFQEIRTPMFERADLFVKGLGVMAGLVEKELWTFHDKHGQKLALKADLTACVARAYHQHSMAQNYPNVARLFYLSPVFLLGKDGEQPSRQAHQFGVEVLGSESPAVDVELLSLAVDFCKDLGIHDYTIELNTLGCDRCRPAYYDALREFFSGRQAELCGTCKRKYRSHPTWTLSCPETACKALANLAPTMLGYLCQDCKSHFNSIKHFVHELNLNVNFNPRVVRDLEYYNRTVFRVNVGDTTIASGGRYDDLIEHLGGPSTAAAGFALNLDEVLTLLEQGDAEADDLDVIFMPEGEESTKVLLPMLQKLRHLGAKVDIFYKHISEMPPHRCLVKLAEATAFRGTAELYHANAENGESIYPDKLLNRLQYLLDLGGEGLRDGGGRGSSRRRLQRSRVQGGTRSAAHEQRVDLRARISKPRPGTQVAADERPDANESMEDQFEAVAEDGADEGDASRRRRRRRRRRGEPGDEARPEASGETRAVEETRRHEEPRDTRDRGRNGNAQDDRGGRVPPRGGTFEEGVARGGRASYQSGGNEGGRRPYQEGRGRGERPARREEPAYAQPAASADRDRDRGDRNRSDRDRDRDRNRDRNGRGDRPEHSEVLERAERTRPEREDMGEREPRPERDSRGERGPRLDRQERTPRPDRGERDSRPEREDRPERGQRPERDERPERGPRPERDDRPERSQRPERDDRPERVERPAAKAPDTGKAFIPALIFGNKAPVKDASEEEAVDRKSVKKSREITAGTPTTATPSAADNAASPALGVNWSISMKTKAGQVSSAQDEDMSGRDDEDAQGELVGSASRGRRPRRRR